MNITIYGTGYVGLVSGACFADAGHHVLCMDVDAERVDRLRQGIVPIYEPGLSVLVERNAAEGRLEFTTDPGEAADFAELQFIAVGTPSGKEGEADLQYVVSVATNIGKHMASDRVVVNKSTVPVGTADLVRETIQGELDKRGVNCKVRVCSNPEFLKEGAAIEDFTRGSRIVVGTDSDDVRRLMRKCYAPYNRNRDKLIFMDIRSAELTKYAANAMLAAKISFINEMARLAELFGADIEEVRQGIGSDPRIGYDFIYPGCGYGGSCFPKDIRALTQSAERAGYRAEMLHAVESVNRQQKQLLFSKLSAALNHDLAGKTIGVWGLAYKPNTDDMREAPSRELLESLWQAGARVRAYDPEAMAEARRLYGDRPDLELAESRESAVTGSDALVICTEWKQFRTVDFTWLRESLRHPVVVDGRNLYEPNDLSDVGLGYYTIGRDSRSSVNPIR
jgi:UDPglucose 6-dehydrogenase